MAAMDGKVTAIQGCDNQFAQRQPHAEGDGDTSVVRTVTCSLVSAAGHPCIDVVPIPAATNEMGHFEAALRQLIAAYGGLGLFRLISYDAGACSEHNARLVVELGYDYLFGLKGTQPTLLQEAKRLLGDRTAPQADAVSEDVVGGGHVVVRRAYLTDEMAGYLDWEHLGTVVRVESETLDRSGNRVASDNRYFVSSLCRRALSPAQWLHAVRAHWGVENHCHNTWDTAFAEDDRPWIQTHPRGTVVVMVLRRIAYNLLTWFRSVTQRSEDNRRVPWKTLLRDVYVTVACTTEVLLHGRSAAHRLFVPP
jgi:predicted transposase YbfD/YdcC